MRRGLTELPDIKSSASGETYKVTVLEDVKHLQIAASFPPLQFGDIFPESINASKGHQPLRIDLPSVADISRKNRYRDLIERHAIVQP